MKIAPSAILVTAALASAAHSTSSTYKLRIDPSNNTDISGKFLALKNSGTSEPNPLGVWGTDRMAREPYQFTMTPAADARFFAISGPGKDTDLVVYGDKVIMGLQDAKKGGKIELKPNEAIYSDKWMFRGNLLIHAQDFNSSWNPDPHGGPGSWRACKGDSVNDYQIYWYDGMSPLPIENCESVQLEAVEASSPSGIFISGAPSPTGVTNASSTSTASPLPFEGSASRATKATGLVGVLFGVFAFFS
ncbi:hypothetical protein K469DRAFT_682451 [Zopfia rhizophila CBS 207.26]|uniref:Uncharacterized protein n=1 Tax=Zopfia rhizophila CBS 207.26 TaxID=1314779 RepID=A0A6A6EGD1_9PEZI|nr:hypothetical protein K469DRAFT_682451 [Zopfia rhizophila CBS 207.26]